MINTSNNATSMGTKIQLCVMMFLQYMLSAVWWGPLAAYLSHTLKLEVYQISLVLSSMAIGAMASSFIGAIADRYFAAEKILAVLNVLTGIFLLIADPKNPFPNGIECQLHAGDAGDLVLLGGSDLTEYMQRPGEERPAFPVVKKHSESSEKPAGEWNEANIFVKDGTITVYVNGVYQNTGTNKVKEGFIGLQSEGKDIQFRNVTLTPWE